MNSSDEIDRLFTDYLNNGDRGSLDRALELASPELLRVGRSLGLDAATAEDALQETMLVLLRRKSDFEEGRTFLPWATGIMRNQSKAAARRRAEERERLMKLARALDGDAAAALERSPQHSDALRRAVRSLPQDQQEVLRLRYDEDLQPVEIARQLELSPNAVSARLTRATRALRRALPPASLLALGADGASDAHGAAVDAARTAPRHATERGSTTASPLPPAAGSSAGKWILIGAGALVLTAVASVSLFHLNGPTASNAARRESVNAADEFATAALERSRRRDSVRGRANGADVDPEFAGFSGRVLRSDGAPAAGAEIFAFHQGGHLELPKSPPLPVLRTAADGTFRIPLPTTGGEEENVHLLLVRHEGEAAAMLSWPGSVIDVKLEPTVEVLALVVDERGRPVPGARVAVVPAVEFFARQNRTVGNSLDQLDVEAHGTLFHGVTDAQGRARVTGIPWESKCRHSGAISAVADGRIAARQRLRWSSPEHVPSVRIEMMRTEERAIGGRIFDENGAPLAGATVRADVAFQRPPAEVLVQSEVDGRFRLPVDWTERLPIVLECSAEGRATVQRSVSPDDLRLDADPIEVRLAPAVPLRGRVVDNDGRPVVNARIERIARGSLQAALSGADGRFAFEDAASVPAMLTLSLKDRAPSPWSGLRISRTVSDNSDSVEFVVDRAGPVHPALLVTVADGRGDPVELTRAILAPLDHRNGGLALRAWKVEGNTAHFARVPEGRWGFFTTGTLPDMVRVAEAAQLEVGGASSHVDVTVGGAARLVLRVDAVTPGREVRIVGRRVALPALPDLFVVDNGWRDHEVHLAVDENGYADMPRLASGTWSFAVSDSTGAVAAPFTMTLAPGSFNERAVTVARGGVLELLIPELARHSFVHVELWDVTRAAWRPLDRIESNGLRPTRAYVSVPSGRVRWRARVHDAGFKPFLGPTYPVVEGATDVAPGERVTVDLEAGVR